MIKKLSTLQLLGLFGVLAVIFIILEFTGGKSRSSSMRETLVDFDTALVTRVLIGSGTAEPFELSRSGSGWEVTLPGGKTVEALKSNVVNSLNTLQTIKPSRIVAKTEEKRAEYQVDSAGTRVQVFHENEKALDLIIGRFGVQGQRNFFTYVRLFDEDEIYTADNFMGVSFGSDPSSYRFKEVVRFVKDSLDRFDFTYPGDSSFTMARAESGKWVIDGTSADSASVQTYLNGVRFLSESNFADDINSAMLGPATFSVVIKRRGDADLKVDAFAHPEHSWIVNSSHNPDSWFSDSEGKLIQKLFPGSAGLTQPADSE